ncbi:ComEC/Rec2 family competence protein [Bdellovibrio sp. NC01]|uniref:ComEC/Rec2 family competence protein n=1 Tax=Bdellovibrio sp. NC01 TaxID=2220073 RepID=UPI0011583C29|nr:hydrolase [Bdellovibrio sp. NC01]QDK38311.1 hydrolase [Bdellovibrio sp. NC01]
MRVNNLPALLCFLIVSLSASPARDLLAHSYFVVWNVGQGQWTTAIDAETCRHFDMGGEFFPLRRLKALCSSKRNEIFLSHWDWDHIGGLAKWRLDSCIVMPPLGKTSERKKLLIEKFTPCGSKSDSAEKTSTTKFLCVDSKRNSNCETSLYAWKPTIAKNTNEQSQVISFKEFLIPGDSPKTEEVYWENQPWVAHNKVLILGHHGSRTSTSSELLDRMPRLTMAIASARWQRYQHPHAETVALLRKRHVALLRTEDWGNLWFEL